MKKTESQENCSSSQTLHKNSQKKNLILTHPKLKVLTLTLEI